MNMDIKSKALFKAEVAIIISELKKAIEKIKDKYATLDERNLLVGSEFESKYDKEIKQVKEDAKLKIAVLKARLERESRQSDKTINYVKEQREWCKFENNNLLITLKDGTQKALSFETQRDTHIMLNLFTILFRHWQKIGTPISKNNIRLGMRNIGEHEEMDDIRIKNSISNLRQKIERVELDTLITITFIRKAQGYSLQISQPS